MAQVVGLVARRRAIGNDSRITLAAAAGRNGGRRMTTDPATPRLAALGSYPGLMVLAFAVFSAATAAGLSVTLASYVAGLTAAALVTAHELKYPYRKQWRPAPWEVRVDALFMVAVQVAVPYLLSITVVLAMAGYARGAESAWGGLWPHELPVVVQTALMLLAADLPRYWLHRAFHAWRPMWRYHAVHHSPRRLYWLNVGRFHPLEKGLQLCVDMLPFAVLGVADEVLATYFVFYAVNGFFQHSNCDVRLGPLNYLVAGPELHRWHHAEDPRESSCNFGNNLIVWDLLFGTRSLPTGRQVGRLGIGNRDYPTGFLGQLKAPFVASLEPGLRPGTGGGAP